MHDNEEASSSTTNIEVSSLSTDTNVESTSHIALHPLPSVQQLPISIQAAFGIINSGERNIGKKRRVTCTYGRTISGLEIYDQLLDKDNPTPPKK